MHIVLYQPEIPPNTGNIARLCAATRTALHLVEPLGFSIDDKHLKRAGLDYWPHVAVRVWPDWEAFLSRGPEGRLVFTSSRGGEAYHVFGFRPDDCIVLGPETRGLPGEITAPALAAGRVERPACMGDPAGPVDSGGPGDQGDPGGPSNSNGSVGPGREASAATIPIWGEVRSLNMSTAAGILLYEALRQTRGFPNPPAGA